MRSIVVLCAFSVLAGAAVPTLAFADVSQITGIDSCLSRLDPQLDIGYERIAAKCPELAKEIDHAAWVAWLPRGWKEPGNDLSGGSLKELRELVVRESAAHPDRAGPDVARLKTVMAGVTVKAEEGWWARLKAWLRSILERRDSSSEENWFDRLASRIGVPQSLRQIIAYGALAAVVLLAAGVVLIELRTLGVLSGTRGRGGRRARALATDSPQLDWSVVEHASVRDRPRLLLELIARRMGEKGLIPPAGGMTARELTAAARLPQADDRDRLSQVARAAEQVRYSAREPAAQDLERSVTRGRELLGRIDEGFST